MKQALIKGSREETGQDLFGRSGFGFIERMEEE